jgi:hypothetical protein
MNAFDSTSDPVYSDGWQAGDNGGFGFTPWNFDARYIGFPQYATPGFKMIDDGLQNGTQFSNPFNNIGRAWTLGLTPNDDGGNHVGRDFSLGIGETLKVIIDNPTEREVFKGYSVHLIGGTGGRPVPKMAFYTYTYYCCFVGYWGIGDATGFTVPGIFDTDTAAGAAISVTRTGANTYDLLVDSFGGKDFVSAGRTFHNDGAEVDWIEFTFYNTVSDIGMPPTTATDFYISEMSIVPEPGCGTLLVLGGTALLGAAGARRRRLLRQPPRLGPELLRLPVRRPQLHRFSRRK